MKIGLHSCSFIHCFLSHFCVSVAVNIYLFLDFSVWTSCVANTVCRVLFDRAAQSNDENLDNTLPESDFLDTSTTLATPLPPLCSSSSSSLDHYTSGQPLSVPSPSPMAASSAAHLPGATNPVSPAVGEMSPLLVRESAALPPSGGQNVAGDGTKPPGGDKNKSPSFKRFGVCLFLNFFNYIIITILYVLCFLDTTGLFC